MGPPLYRGRGCSRLDPHSSKTPLAPAEAPDALVLGVPDEGFFEGFDTDPEVWAVMDEATDVLGSIVAEVRTVRVPNTAEHFDAGAAIVFAESAALLGELRASSNELIGELVAVITDGPDSPMCGKAAVRTYPTAEAMGLVWVFVGAAEPHPLSEQLREELADPPPYAVGGRIEDRDGDWRLFAENGFDEGHAKYLHRTSWWRTLKVMPTWNKIHIERHGQFSAQDHWMVAETDAPPERLYRPDISLIEWRRLVEEAAGRDRS